MITKTSFTEKGRLRVCSMPYLYGKELKIAKDIRDSLKEIATSLRDLVEIQREKNSLLITQQTN